MKQNVLMVLAGIACIVMIAVAGCTSSTGSAATATPTATSEVTAAATTTAAAETTAQPNVTAAAAAAVPNFAGDWNTTWKSGKRYTPCHCNDASCRTMPLLPGPIPTPMLPARSRARLQATILTGSWKETDPDTTYSGALILTLLRTATRLPASGRTTLMLQAQSIPPPITGNGVRGITPKRVRR